MTAGSQSDCGSALAVVIPAAQGSPHLERACRAALEQGSARLYVVSEAEPSGAPFEASHLRVDDGAGFAKRANAGLAAAAADGFVQALLLNDDTQLLPGCLEALQDALKQPGVAVCGAVLQDWDGDSIQQSGIRVSERSGRIRVLDDDPGHGLWDRDSVSGAAMAVDLQVWRELGGLCEDFTFYFEDVDFCRRVRRSGRRVVVCGDARVRHREGGTRSRQSPGLAWHLGRSQVLFARRLGGGTLSRQARLVSAVTTGLGWSGRTLGVRGMGGFVRGAWSGLRAPRGEAAPGLPSRLASTPEPGAPPGPK